MPKYSVIVAAVLVVSLIIYAAIEYGDVAPKPVAVAVEVEVPTPKPEQVPVCAVSVEAEATPKCLDNSKEELDAYAKQRALEEAEKKAKSKFKAEYNFND